MLEMSKVRRLEISDLAIAAIREAQKPISSKKILEYARRNRFDRLLSGATPRNSIQSSVWKDIHRNGARSPFVMIGKGRVNRKYWLRGAILRKRERLVVSKVGGILKGEWVG